MYQDIHDFDIPTDGQDDDSFHLSQLPRDDATINIKMFKNIFNRAYRLKHTNSKEAVKVLNWLKSRITKMLEEEDTYYITLISFELVRVYTLMEDM